MAPEVILADDGTETADLFSRREGQVVVFRLSRPLE
jgi:hypothetical protein